MTTPQRHTIGKQVIDVTFNGFESGAMALQSAISGLNQLGVTPAIERILDGYADSSSVLKIDRLEIDAGSVRLSQLEERLPEIIAEALDKALAEVTTSGAEPLAETTNQPTGRRLFEEEAAVDALLFFLRHATLPATFRPASHEHFETQLFKAWQRPDLIRETAEALATPTARQRLLAQFSRQVTATLIEALSPDAMPVIENILDSFRQSSLTKESMRRIEDDMLDEAIALSATRTNIATAELREALLTAALSRPELSDEFKSNEFARATDPRTEQYPSATESPDEATARQTRDSAPPADRQSEQKAQSAPGKAAQEPEEIRSDRSDGSLATPPNTSSDTTAESATTPDSSSGSRYTNAFDRKADNVPDEKTNEPSAHEASAKQRETASPTPPLPNSGKPDQKTLEPVHEHPDERRGLYVENAGLVLLHPFLPQLFRALKVAGEHELLRPGEALRLLHYLATGSEVAPEYDLVLPKILCGLAPTSLAGEIAPLSNEEREESSALLSAVVSHWDALKNTGIDALRESFLKRNGKLTRWHEGGWLLQVESNSFDILLDRLPWGFSLIRLPWMPSMLHVEWRF